MSRRSAVTLALVTVAALAAGCQSTTDERSDRADPATTPAPDPARSGTPAGGTATGGTPTSGAPDPGATSGSPGVSPSTVSAANTAAVCRAVDQLIIDGSRRITDDSAAASRRQLTPEQVTGELRDNLARLADDLREEAARAGDPRIRALVTTAAERIDRGAATTSPARWMQTGFVAIPEQLSRDCRV